jgi:hypothetical protein
MSTVQNATSSNTDRSVRDVINTGTGAGDVPSFYAAKSTWTETTVPFDTIPQVAAPATWVLS